MMLRARLIGTGSALPVRIVTNDELAQSIDTSDEWITQRSGIRQRHVAADGELTSDLATAAAKAALQQSGIDAANLDLIVLATTTPDQTFPATATRVQAQLGAHKAFAFDVQAVCSGFIYALAIADNFIKAAQVKEALVIGAETFTRLLNWQDRATSVLFGDGAGAVVLSAEKSAGIVTDRGILSTHLRSDGRLHDILYVDGGPSSTQTSGHVKMAGREVFKQAVNHMTAVVETALAANNLDAASLDWVVPHQANLRILTATAQKLGVPLEKFIITVGHHANTSAASVPLALDVGLRDGRIKPGHLVMLEAMGGGLTWGSALVRV